MTKALTCGSGNIRCVRKVWAAIEIPLITKEQQIHASRSCTVFYRILRGLYSLSLWLSPDIENKTHDSSLNILLFVYLLLYT